MVKTKQSADYPLAKEGFTPKEIYGLAITSLVLGFAFSFNDWGPGGTFELSTGLQSLIITIALVGLTLLTRELVRRRYAKTEDATVEYSAWPSGWFYTILLAFLTNGYFVLAIPGSVDIKSTAFSRAGRKTRLAHLGPDEIALIILTGIFANVLLAAFAKLLVAFGYTSYITTQLFRINAWMALFSILPLFKFIPLTQAYIQGLFTHPASAKAGERGELETQIAHIATKRIPNFEGELVLFGSRAYWIFSFAFVVFAITTLIFIHPLASIVLSAILATAILVYFQKYF